MSTIDVNVPLNSIVVIDWFVASAAAIFFAPSSPILFPYNCGLVCVPQYLIYLHLKSIVVIDLFVASAAAMISAPLSPIPLPKNYV